MSHWYLRLGQELSEGSSRPCTNDAVAGKDDGRLGLVDELGSLLYLTGRGTSLFGTSNLRDRRSMGSFVCNILWDLQMARARLLCFSCPEGLPYSFGNRVRLENSGVPFRYRA